MLELSNDVLVETILDPDWAQFGFLRAFLKSKDYEFGGNLVFVVRLRRGASRLACRVRSRIRLYEN